MGCVLFEQVCARMYVSRSYIHAYITDEGGQRIPKCLEIVNLSASVNKPQSSHVRMYVHLYVGWYANNILTASSVHVCACVFGCLCACLYVCLCMCQQCAYVCEKCKLMTMDNTSTRVCIYLVMSAAKVLN